MGIKFNQFLALFLIGSFTWACEMDQEGVPRYYEESFEGIKEIEVNGRFLEVSYEGNENATIVELDGYTEVPEGSDIEIKYRQSGSKLIVEVKGESSNINFFTFGGQKKGFINLSGPENIKLNVFNSSGAIDIKYVQHDEIELKVNSGSIKALALEVNNILLKASSGSIKLESAVGDVNAQVNSGSIRMNEIKGNVDVKASSGSVRLDDVEGLVNAKVNSGSIKLDQVKYIGDLSVSSGGVSATESGLSEFTQLKSSSGSIKIQTLTDLKLFDYDLVANSGSVRVGEDKSSKRLEINNGSSHVIKGRASSGSIKITND
ncbi:DUF4097 family beta strand repeat-containing protein [Belliella kenyensis]|uniref:DUF4097 family beta strand repeat-containing protein n=1 Tax=Belliella kenyensis TaxID=1472724 RepID=A0ABV8EHN0_9BACT|nr:DUF4097 family beta strand repeat-containing protein [Belliella kenyensis]MCH7401920.1 DUF4097 domain-containing protein [Belliella kenyensis]MDN3604420.1 DUF4097 family beta strand repeat-containing protein [Belliella kenyensis]